MNNLPPPLAEKYLPKSQQIKILTRTKAKALKLNPNLSNNLSNLEIEKIKAEIRWDDQCHNGHNTFAITAITYNKNNKEESYGCCHEDFIQFFPEYAHLVKWHLVSSNGPLHYLANTLYLASDKDCNGKRKEEPSSFKLGLKFEKFPTIYYSEKFLKWLEVKKLEKDEEQKLEQEYKQKEIQEEIQEEIQYKQLELNFKIKTTPGNIYNFEIIEFPYISSSSINSKDLKLKPKYSFKGYGKDWYEAPFSSRKEAEELIEALNTYPWEIVQEVTSYSKGKEVQLEAARNSAIAPNATLEQLQDKEWLLERLPKLMEEFKADIESLGFIY